MNHSTLSLALATGLALALSACGDNDVEEAETSVATEEVAAVDFDPMTRDYTLSEDAQARRAAFDSDAFQTEYGGYRNDIVGEQVETGTGNTAPNSTNTSTNGDMSSDERTEMDAAAQPRDANTNMRTRANMTWSYLDRNSDGRLSVAEYAIWAIPLNPTNPKPNDQAPFVTADQANKAADSFFYYDRDGDTYLSQREFTSARRGDTVS